MTTPTPTYDEIDLLADTDPLKLRDLAWSLVRQLEQQATPPNPADVETAELVGRTLADHTFTSGYFDACTCGQWHEDGSGGDWHYHLAEVAVAALAGRLLPEGGETIAVPRALLAGIFDLAVNTLDFGSGFWDDDDVRTGRAVAELLGVNPLEATPIIYRERMEHAFKPAKYNGICDWCRLLPDADVHQVPTPATTPGADRD